jgi:hypothetical protein
MARQNADVRLLTVRRSISWALAALLPVAGAAVMIAAPDDPAKAPAFLPQWSVVVEYWFLVLVVVLIAQMLFFAVHAWRNPKVGHNRRLLWVIAIALGSLVATPVYWWVYGEPAT